MNSLLVWSVQVLERVLINSIPFGFWLAILDSLAVLLCLSLYKIVFGLSKIGTLKRFLWGFLTCGYANGAGMFAFTKLCFITKFNEFSLPPHNCSE